jgi:hypothetical protein
VRKNYTLNAQDTKATRAMGKSRKGAQPLDEPGFDPKIEEPEALAPTPLTTEDEASSLP